MKRFSFATLLVLACALHTCAAANLSAADKAGFKSSFKTTCMQSNSILANALEPGEYETMCDCSSDRILARLATLPQNEAAPLLNADSDEGKKKWAEMGREASMACGAKPFSLAMTRVMMKSCIAGKLSTNDGKPLMMAQRCECISQEFASRYTLAAVQALDNQDAINRLAQQTILISQSACKPK